MPNEQSDLLQGTLDMLILKIVALGPIHGYGISLRIRQISKKVLFVQQGSLYPALHRLEKRGWLAAEWGESENGRQAKFYKLSAKGRKQLASEESNWRRLAGAVASPPTPASSANLSASTADSIRSSRHAAFVSLSRPRRRRSVTHAPRITLRAEAHDHLVHGYRSP